MCRPSGKAKQGELIGVNTVQRGEGRWSGSGGPSGDATSGWTWKGVLPGLAEALDRKTKVDKAKRTRKFRNNEFKFTGRGT